MSEFELELLRWQDSNHECILFNNEAHTVAFLCANPSLMKRSLHPMLLRHLEQNGIHIEGASGGGDAFSASYCKTLSALTGIPKGEKEASQVESLTEKVSFCILLFVVVGRDLLSDGRLIA